MRTRFLVLASVAGLTLASLAGAASASTTITTVTDCSGVYAYHNTSTLTISDLTYVVQTYTKTYSFHVAGGLETCTVTVS